MSQNSEPIPCPARVAQLHRFRSHLYQFPLHPVASQAVPFQPVKNFSYVWPLTSPFAGDIGPGRETKQSPNGIAGRTVFGVTTDMTTQPGTTLDTGLGIAPVKFIGLLASVPATHGSSWCPLLSFL